MLPSLYVNYVEKKNYESVVSLQKEYMETGSYDNIQVQNPMSSFTIEIPMTENIITICGKYFTWEKEVSNKELLSVLDKIRYYAKYPNEMEEGKQMDWELPTELFPESEITLKELTSFEITASEFHVVSQDIWVAENTITDGSSYYTTYIAMGVRPQEIILTLAFYVTPQMNEITPVVMGSLPMIIAVAFLLVLISSQIFSRLIINPIIKLSNHAYSVKESELIEFVPIPIKGEDEISRLGETLNELYGTLAKNYLELSEKNEFLAAENKRQEVFLRGASHQLKTPVAAALLLTEGMINEVGKYKDTKTYLPQLKIQLKSMEQMIGDILYLSAIKPNEEQEMVDLSELIQGCLGRFSFIAQEKNLDITLNGVMDTIMIDQRCIEKVLDNVISNSIFHTPDSNKVELELKGRELFIRNYGVTIPKELLPHIFEPFVTSNTVEKGHGLGLYVAAYYGELLGCKISMENMENGVLTTINFS